MHVTGTVSCVAHRVNVADGQRRNTLESGQKTQGYRDSQGLCDVNKRSFWILIATIGGTAGYPELDFSAGKLSGENCRDYLLILSCISSQNQDTGVGRSAAT